MSDSYENYYLDQYWPPEPNNSDMWQDNLELLQAYFLAAKVVQSREEQGVSALDISTGPCLAPLMASMKCMESIRLSDYTESNRRRILDISLEYWREYARELCRLFPSERLVEDALLERVDTMRRQYAPLDVDLRRNPVFLPDEVGDQSVQMLTMHFVVDSICETSAECFHLLDIALGLIRPEGWLLMSSLIDSSWWLLGDVREPSPKISEGEMDAFLAERQFDIVDKWRSERKALQIYEGGWTVFLAQRRSQS